MSNDNSFQKKLSRSEMSQIKGGTAPEQGGGCSLQCPTGADHTTISIDACENGQICSTNTADSTISCGSTIVKKCYDKKPE